MKALMKSNFLFLKRPILVWMLMTTVASSSLIAQPPKFDDTPIAPPTNSTATSSTSSSSSTTSSSLTSKPNVLRSPLKEEVEAVLSAPRAYNVGLIFEHVEKCGGSSTHGIFTDNYKVFGASYYIGELSNAALRLTIEESTATGGHVNLATLVACNSVQRPIITFTRDPFIRVISHLRYWKGCAHVGVHASPFWNMPHLDLNNIHHIKDIFRDVPGIVVEFHHFAPPGLDVSFETMTEEKVDQCVIYAQNLAFIGEIETFSDSLHRLNLALGLKLNADQEAEVRVNVTPDTVEKIINPEVLAFLKERTKWATKLWEKLRAAQRWRIAMPMAQDRDMPGFALTQFILPQGFDPDVYLVGNHDLGSIASIKFGNDIWKKREYALRHYVARGKAEGRIFDFSSFPQLENGRRYPKMSFMNNARWPGLITKVQGLSGTESWATWSEGHKVTFEFISPLPKGFSFRLNVAAAFGSNIGRDFVATVGNSVRKFQSKGWVAEEFILSFINPTASNIFTIDIPQPTAPASLTDGVGDPRLLGLAFVSLEVIPLLYPELSPVLEFLENRGQSSTSCK
jgi:hypothetical protein